MKPIEQQAFAISGVALDVDGTLTDGTVAWSVNGDECKRFNFQDIMGISRAAGDGVKFALISGEASPLVEVFARKCGITDIFIGCKDKAAALRTFSERTGIPLQNLAFVGDDINDIEAMRISGLSGAPSNAHPLAKAAATLTTVKSGGSGAVREFIDFIMGCKS